MERTENKVNAEVFEKNLVKSTYILKGKKRENIYDFWNFFFIYTYW